MVELTPKNPAATALLPRLRLAIDGNEANVANRVGSNVYAFEIIKHLEILTAKRTDIAITVLLAAPPLPHLPPSRVGWEYAVVSPPKFWTQWALPIHLFWHKADYDVLFTPGHYAPRFSAIPYVSSVMDLAFEKYPDDFQKSDYLQLKAWTEYSVKRASQVIAISEFTKKEVARVYGKPATAITVAYPSVALSNRFSQRAFEHFLRQHQITGPYILTMGTLQPRKNLIRLVEAFENIATDTFTNPALPQPYQRKTVKGTLVGKRPTTTTPLKLVIAGKVGWLADELLQKIAASPLKEQIVLTGFVPDELKQPLYTHAVCTAVISPYEGFGIPALEALTSGGLVVAAQSSSLPEVVGAAGIMVNPSNVGSIANGLLHTLHLGNRERQRLIRLGKQQAHNFSWLVSAQLILDTLTTVATKP